MVKCVNCKQDLPTKRFNKNLNKKSGFQSWCTRCRSKANAKRNKERRHKDPISYRKLIKRRELKYKYGITLETYYELVKIQTGRCAICNDVPKKKKLLCVDHDHKTGEVRGLLCHNCNTGLGFFNDTPEFLQRAIKYLKLFE